jgi:UDP-N-acetylglucosamine--N-acetylmuramyl-(pentapeptide) pyrophosphoryl-undecaprenol N-acetylglucosamine transferase
LTIVLTGGGSGGHITPVLAVAAELKRRKPDARIVYVGQKGDGLADIPAADPNIDTVYAVRAGKFRRYHGEGWKQLLDLKTIFLNIRDAVYVLIGLVQSYLLMGKLRPEVIFSRGGYVSVPVCLGGHMRGVPYITHDSDPIPSLANRIIARWAAKHAVALPKDIYPYPADKTVTTGIPLNSAFVPVTPELQARYRRELELPADCKLLFVIGGGLGSQRVNLAMAEAMPHLLHEFKQLRVVQVAGRNNLSEVQKRYAENLSEAEQRRLTLLGFTNDVYRYSGAADLVVTRAGATNLAEFAVQGKACIIIPSPFLTGGHQLKNAQYLADKDAVVVVDETELDANPNRLAALASELLHNDAARHRLGKGLAEFSQPHAAKKIADIILELA